MTSPKASGAPTVYRINVASGLFQPVAGEPTVEIQSPDLDILWLRGKLSDGSDFALSSGTNSNGRFHIVTVVDNSRCKK